MTGRRLAPGEASRRTLRKQAHFRGRIVAGAALALGLRHLIPLINALADWSGYSDAYGHLPHPSEQRLANELGVTARTISTQVGQLETAGLIQVFRSAPHQVGPAHQYTRQTNRYLLCDRRWQHFRASPVRRRHAKPQVDPTRSQLRVTLFHGEEPGGPVANPPPGHPPEPPQTVSDGAWHPSLVGLSWRDFVRSQARS